MCVCVHFRARGPGFICKGDSSSVRLERAGSLATSSLSLQSFSRSCHPIHVAVSLLYFSCLMFPLVFSMMHSSMFIWLSPSMSCDISAPSHNRTCSNLHSHGLAPLSYFFCPSVFVSSCARPSILCCSLVVLSLHAPDRWIYVLWQCVHRRLTGKALQISSSSVNM